MPSSTTSGSDPVADLAFDIVGAEPDRYGASPTMLFTLRIAETSGDPIHTMVLRSQVQIDAQLRSYSDAEKKRLGALFGVAERWGDTLRPFNWTHGSTMVQGFRNSTEVELGVPCSYDFDVAASTYMQGLDDGEIPLSFLFSGTVISRGATGYAVTQIPWHKESTYRLPVQAWRALMETYFPGTAWLRVRQDTFEELVQRRADGGHTDWDSMFDELLGRAS
jgi:hypothetical protein